ncbi:hypothetical protein DACRYDRAFT_19406 [Dacryopinax primogenitus]|uniref:Uncharacterized protein n=1 Tax=Dacryopinax primogenitus (strain DJM 731) TaxID=1858805 RepID=M5GFB0_DACPD|nr:uncharacterized protein DACRYDRAFT_19406 [Dacryopinax primogenitus]EJU06107.1 hypothetical protein DACRYDRAFT_19406 [Dacryopinax primogenitus]
MPVHANLPTPAQAYAAQHTSPPSSSTDNARLSPVSMRRAPSTSPNSGQGGDPPSIDHVGSPAPTYASNNSSSPLPSPPTQGSRPYDIALAESVIPVSESVKQMHQQFQQQSQSQSLKRYSMAPSIAPSVASGPPPPVPAYPLGMQSYNPLNAYNPPATPAPPPIQQQQQYSPSVPGYPQQGLAHSQSLYSLPTGPPRGHVPPAPGQMYPQPGYPQGQAQPWGQQGEQGGQQPVSGWQQQGTYRR